MPSCSKDNHACFVWATVGVATALLATSATAAAVLILRRISDSVGLAPPTSDMEIQEKATGHCALLRHLPHLRLAWRSLGAVTPTPLHLVVLGEPQGRRFSFMVKREDLICPPQQKSYGGNKVRTLQHQLAVCEARRERGERAFRQLVSLGTGGSNQVVATVVHARRLGWTAADVAAPAVNVAWVERDKPDLDNTLNMLSTLSFPTGWRYNWGEPLRPDRLFSALWQTMSQDNFIPMSLGGNCPSGVLGQVSGALELAEQLETSQQRPQVTRLYVPVGSACTVSGLVVGTVLAKHLGYKSLDNLCIVGCNVHELIAMLDRLVNFHVNPMFAWVPLTIVHSVTQACRALVQLGGPDILTECLAFCRNPKKLQSRSDSAVVGKYGGHSDLTKRVAQLYDATGIVQDANGIPQNPLWICGHFVAKALQPLLTDLEEEYGPTLNSDSQPIYLLWMTKSAIQPLGEMDEWELFKQENTSVMKWANDGKAESTLRPGRVSIDGSPEDYRPLMTPVGDGLASLPRHHFDADMFCRRLNPLEGIATCLSDLVAGSRGLRFATPLRQRKRLSSGNSTSIGYRILFVVTLLSLFICWAWLLVRVFSHSNIAAVQRNNAEMHLSRSGWAIFYHIYLPHKGRKHALGIVHEQLAQIDNCVQNRNNSLPTKLYYTTVGDAISNRDTEFFQGCATSRALECQYRQHLSQGGEMATLQALFDYCQQAGPDHIVTYLHSKGSYHPNKVNNVWRLHLTNAALHVDCIANTKTGECDVCGLHFYSQWTNFFPGNMFTARCGYLQKLLPPDSFSEQQEQAVADLLWLRHQGVLSSRLFKDRLDYFGLDRYSMEHWVGSHPDLQPCDIGMKPFESFLKGHATETDYMWSIAPRQTGPPVDVPSSSVIDFLQRNQTERLKEIFYLPGRLHLWKSLYRALPSDSSWVWGSFPDGQYWREKIKNPDGLRDADYALPTDPFSKSITGVTSFDIESPAIFMNPKAKANQSMNNLSFFSLLGMENTLERHVVELRSTTDRQLDHVLEGEIFRQIYEHCQQNKALDTIVMYILMTSDDQAQELSICLRSLRHGSCNVCGPTLLTGPVLHFENSWAAKCSYINQLKRPDEYVIATNQASVSAWVEELKGRFKGVPKSPSCLFIESHALQSWVTSHPDVLPCQLPSYSYQKQNGSMCSDETGVTDEQNTNLRLQAYSLLAGHLWRWGRVYGQAPSPSSWMWAVYPDGDFWKKSTSAYGVDGVVERVTQPLAKTSIKK